jgi:hypothetical protein
MTMLIAACAALSHFGVAAAEDDAEVDEVIQAATQYVRGFQEQQTLLAEAEARKRETEWLTTNRPGDGTLAALADIDPEAQAIFRELLEGDAEKVHERLGAVRGDAAGRVTAAADSWQRGRAELYRRQIALFNTSQAQRAAGSWVTLMSFDNRWFWLAAVLAIASLIGLALHSRRCEVRKVFHGGRSTALTLTICCGVLLIAVSVTTAAVFVFGEGLYETLLSAAPGDNISPKQRIADVNVAQAREIQRLRSQQDAGAAEYQTALDAWHQSLSDAAPPASQLVQNWRESREIIHALSVHLAVEQRLIEATVQDTAQLANIDEQLQAAAAGTGELLNQRRRTRVGFGVSLVVLTTLGTLVFWRVDRSRRQQIANTCPRCGAEGSLAPLANDRRRTRCNNRINRDPEVHCQYTFATAERERSKLSFPTWGVGACGKTQWAAMVYRQLSEGRHPPAVHFRRNEAAKNEAFDAIVAAILAAQGAPATDPGEFPTPLCLTFRDRDRLGRTDVTGCIFDFAGEIVTAVDNNIDADDYRRRRALDADGLLLLLDPTQPGPPQSKALEVLGQDLRRRRHLKPDAVIRTPVAVCFTKIDLLTSQPYAADEDGRPVREFYRQLAEIDPDGEELSRRVIKARAALCRDLRRTIWPHWNLEQQLDGLFGRRQMFFPLSAVGLDHLGETNPREQTIAPFGVLEPLMWLLHVNGHPCLG